MKNILKIVALILFSTTNGQITKPLENRGGVEENVYYKDFNNVLNEFEGTYEYNGPDFYFKLVLQKKVAENNNNYWWTDVLKGTYQYIVNGVEVNFLSDPMASDGNPARVQADWIINGNPRYCPDCLQNEKRMRGYISRSEERRVGKGSRSRLATSTTRTRCSQDRALHKTTE